MATKAKAQKVVVEIDGEVFEVDRSALKSVKTGKRAVPSVISIFKDIKSHDPKLQADLEAMYSDYLESIKLSIPGIGCKKGSMEFFFSIVDGDVMPIDFTMDITNLDSDQIPVFMEYWCDERSLKDAFSADEIWDYVLRVQNAATMDKADKMINKILEKYKALRGRVGDFIKDHYDMDDDGIVDCVMNEYETSYGGALE